MSRTAPVTTNPGLDLVLDRVVDVPPEKVWAAWTIPQHVMKWFTPAPWTTVACEIDLRPGGIFRTVVRSPEGEEHPNLGCYLEIVENERLVWTCALEPGFRPVGAKGATTSCGPFLFTAIIHLQPHGQGTRYTATVLHADQEGRRAHEEMGFHDGWGTALDQLVALARTHEP